MSRNTVARIDLDALRHNLGVVRRMAGKSKIVCVIKADAYGHGISRVARALNKTDVFAVATPDEALQVREAGWQGRLLLLEGFSNREGLALARRLELELVVHQRQQLEQLSSSGCVRGQRLWIKLDSGMHRLGFPLQDAAELIRVAEGIRNAGDPVLMTHFACADDPANPMTATQTRQFDAALKGFPHEQSLSNSAGLLNFPEASRDYVRPGIMLYGISPNPGETGADHGLNPVMTLSCELIAINRCHKGDRIGYGAAFVCDEDMPVGVAAIGYGDGYPRHLRNGCPVLVDGQQARLAGRVSMDLVTIDLRGLRGVSVGSEVVLWGNGLPVEKVAPWESAIPYELVCGVTGRVERVDS